MNCGKHPGKKYGNPYFMIILFVMQNHIIKYPNISLIIRKIGKIIHRRDARPCVLNNRTPYTAVRPKQPYTIHNRGNERPGGRTTGGTAGEDAQPCVPTHLNHDLPLNSLSNWEFPNVNIVSLFMEDTREYSSSSFRNAFTLIVSILFPSTEISK